LVLATVKNGDGGDASLYLRAPDGRWARIAADADRVVRDQFASDGSLYLLSYKGSPRGAILRLAAGASDAMRRPPRRWTSTRFWSTASA
jgi:hypothetical protein